MTLHAFVDESLSAGYLVAAAIIPAAGVAQARRTIRGELDRRQRRIHFKDESPARKDRIVSTVGALGVTARVYVTRHTRAARMTCLSQMVPDLADAGVTRLILERDDSVLNFDRQALFQLTRKHAPELEYQHLRAHEDLLLCVADTIAWCWAKGGPWRARIDAFTTEIQV